MDTACLFISEDAVWRPVLSPVFPGGVSRGGLWPPLNPVCRFSPSCQMASFILQVIHMQEIIQRN